MLGEGAREGWIEGGGRGEGAEGESGREEGASRLCEVSKLCKVSKRGGEALQVRRGTSSRLCKAPRPVSRLCKAPRPVSRLCKAPRPRSREEMSWRLPRAG
ncbi:hypothetical protein T484DRAFT_1972846 [Baffinella frigidus]|nr:hypothetical protein T484DRAFT_1972846 [Cryptophyta sp. CCMP2293]